MICTILYVAVALVITGMVNYDEINPDAALAEAFIAKGKDGYATLISAGAVAGLTTVVMTLMIGAVRVTFAMCRDHLLPSSYAHVSRKTGTPVRLTIGIGLVVALVASLTPVGKLEEMVNIGTLTAFLLVSIAIPVLRKNRPDLERSFKVPLSPFLPWLRGRHLPVPDDQPDRRDLAAVPGLDAARLRHLLRLRLPATAGSARARASRPRTTRADRPACGSSSPSSAGAGHLDPLLPLARAMAAAGHTVAIAGSGNQMPRVEAQGFTALPTSEPRPASAVRPRLHSADAGRTRSTPRSSSPRTSPARALGDTCRPSATTSGPGDRTSWCARRPTSAPRSLPSSLESRARRW